jgi:hypothetical protein
VSLAIYHGLKKWELMREIAKRLADFQPNDIQWIRSYAYATRRAESIPAAKEILLNAKTKFPKEAIIKSCLLLLSVGRHRKRQKLFKASV